MRSRKWIAIVALATLGGCAHGPVVDVGPLGAEARANEVAAYARHKDRTVWVHGVVESTGLRDVAHVEFSGYGYPVSGRRVVQPYPFVRLRDAAGTSTDLVVCYFEPDEAADVGQVTTGMAVTVLGDFQQYALTGAQVLIVMRHCALK